MMQPPLSAVLLAYQGPLLRAYGSALLLQAALIEHDASLAREREAIKAEEAITARARAVLARLCEKSACDRPDKPARSAVILSFPGASARGGGTR